MTPETSLKQLFSPAFWWLLPGLAWAVAIFVIISLAPDDIPQSPLLLLPHIDKAIHFLMFAVFGGLLLLGVCKQNKGAGITRSRKALVFLTGSAYGALTELYQHLYLPGRHGNIPDTLANIFGTVFGVLFVAMIIRSAKAKRKKKTK